MNTRHVIADEVLDATITALSKGVYNLRIITSGEIINKQVVIQ